MSYLAKFLLIISIGVLISCTSAEQGTATQIVPGLPVENTVTMVDLGAKTCIPCKMMAPILEELKEDYKGRAAVIFIDVWEQGNKEKARAFKVMSIPTQVFYDKQGKEVYRHLGFLDKDSIVEKLEELLAQ